MTIPTFEMQSALAAMADYPAMLRRLGVVRVIEVDLAGTGINPAAGGPVTISATPTWPTKLSAAQVTVAPVQVPAYLSASRFALSADGRVDPAQAGLEVAEVDTDSAAVRLVDLARQVVNAETANADAAKQPSSLPPVSLPERLALPSLRNAGLSVVQRDRAVDLRGRLESGRGLHTATGAHQLADAGHAVKGYVLDVWDDRTRRWHTLCARRGTYQLPGGRSFTLDDEGTISLAATAGPDADRYAPLYLHQSVARWTGWSLVASRPGQPVTTESPGNAPAPGGPALPGFAVSFAPLPGTLPRLRFGVGYRFQLRAVDVVGHTDPLDPASSDFSRAVPAPAQSPARYLRFDPVVAPALIAAAPMTEGESVQTLVVRPDPLDPIRTPESVRHLAPPKVSELLCEEHGMFDDARGVPVPSRYSMIAQRDASDLSTVGNADPGRPGQRYFSGSALPVTWLPDPLCRGAAIAGLPGGLVQVRFDPGLLQSWPDLRPVRLRLADGSAAPQWNAPQRILTVSVPRGETYPVRLSSFVDTGDLAVLGHLGWLADSGAPASLVQAVRADTVTGQAWQITPYRTLTLVNAVRVPVAPPQLTVAPDPDKPRAAGSTSQDLAGTATVHRPSTGTLTLDATWTDPVDDPADPTGPRTVTATASPSVRTAAGTPGTQLAVDYGTDPQVTFSARHSFGDTRRHRVSYALTGITRYMEYFTQRGKLTLTGTAPVRVSTTGIAPGSDTVRSADGTTNYRRDVDYTVDYGAGTVARLSGGGIASGTAVEMAVVALPVSRPSAGDPIILDLPSTARPMPPQVAWVVPTFGWNESTGDLGLRKTRMRTGGGLRVFLERPWYSSGTGEQLAVVLADGPAAPIDPRLLSLVTRLGADPVVTPAEPGRFPAPADFPLATERRGGLASADLAGATTAIAAHEVSWDPDRQRWACDIVLPPGRAYQPFVALSLARYQPHSISGVELSPVASVEWTQLAPDRSATVVMDLLDLTKVTVTVAGRSPAGTSAAGNQPNAVSVIVQTAAGGLALTPGELDWQIAGPVDGQRLDPAPQPDGSTLWTGTLHLPTARLLKPYRLVITEQEQHQGGGRLVYSDAIRL